jgi:hypothetical protein
MKLEENLNPLNVIGTLIDSINNAIENNKHSLKVGLDKLTEKELIDKVIIKVHEKTYTLGYIVKRNTELVILLMNIHKKIIPFHVKALIGEDKFTEDEMRMILLYKLKADKFFEEKKSLACVVDIFSSVKEESNITLTTDEVAIIEFQQNENKRTINLEEIIGRVFGDIYTKLSPTSVVSENDTPIENSFELVDVNDCDN